VPHAYSHPLPDASADWDAVWWAHNFTVSGANERTHPSTNNSPSWFYSCADDTVPDTMSNGGAHAMANGGADATAVRRSDNDSDTIPISGADAISVSGTNQ
jgi:hypothetical protein